jgi:hypothetical protein
MLPVLLGCVFAKTCNVNENTKKTLLSWQTLKFKAQGHATLNLNIQPSDTA